MSEANQDQSVPLWKRAIESIGGILLFLTLLAGCDLVYRTVDYQLLDYSPDGQFLLGYSHPYGMFAISLEHPSDFYTVTPTEFYFRARFSIEPDFGIAAHWSPSRNQIAASFFDTRNEYAGLAATIFPLTHHRFPEQIGIGRVSDFSPNGSLVVSRSDGITIVSSGAQVSAEIPISGPSGVTWSPTRQIFAIASDSGSYVYDVSGNTVANLPGSYPGREQEFSWSPNGDQVAYMSVSPETRDVEIFIYDMETRRSHRLVSGINPAWSPAGDVIAFQSGDQSDLQLVKLSHGNVIQVATHTNPMVSPVWSHDGRWLAYEDSGVSLDPKGMSSVEALCVVSALGGPPITVTNRVGNWMWSPRQNQIAYEERDLALVRGVYVLNLPPLTISSRRMNSLPAWAVFLDAILHLSRMESE